MKKLLQKKVLIPVIIVLLIGGGVAYGKSKKKTEPEEKTPKVAGVSVETVSTKSEVNIPIKVTGQIKGKQSTEIRALVDGTLQSLSPVGSQVSQGTPLFRLSNQSVEAQYQNALSAYNNAQFTSTETEASASNSLAQAQLTVDQAEANLSLAKQAYADGQTTAELNLKIASGNAQVVYLQGYNTLEDVMRYLGGAFIDRFTFEHVLAADNNSHSDAKNKFALAKEDFLKLSASPSQDAKTDLVNLKSTFDKVNSLNNSTATLLSFVITGNDFTDTELAAAETQVATFRASLNSLQTLIVTNLNNLENIEEQNKISVEGLKKRADIAEIQLRAAETGLASQKNASTIQKIGASSSLSGSASQLASARRNFQNLQVPAPFAGTIISHKVSIGSQVSPGQIILEIGNLNIIEIKINLSNSLANGLKLGQSVRIDGQEIGRISEIEAAASLSSGKIGVTIEADNQNGQFTSGSIADIEFDLVFETDGAIVVPLKLIKISQDFKSVLVIREGKVIEQPVQLGQLFNDQVEITQGLVDGDMLIVENGGFLSEGDPVKINQ